MPDDQHGTVPAMTVTSKIEWTDTTWNPTTGCDRVSPGCDHCYALTMARRLKGMGQARYQRDGDPRTSGPGFGVSVHPAELTAPLRWRKPRRVFVDSMGDLFHDQVPDDFIAHVWAVMAMAPLHTFQILTKRHGRMRSLLNSPQFWEMVGTRGRGIAIQRAQGKYPSSGPMALTSTSSASGSWEASYPLPNVWLGVSVEDQQRADLRIPALLETPAAVRFLSCEPLLGQVDLTPYLHHQCDCIGDNHTRLSEYGPRPNWVIVGGESGPGTRPMHPQWARQLRDQCQAAGVPYFFKQWGAWGPVSGAEDWVNRQENDREVRADGYHWPLGEPHGAEDGTEILMRKVGKAAAGRELDGRTWDEFPGVIR